MMMLLVIVVVVVDSRLILIADAMQCDGGRRFDESSLSAKSKDLSKKIFQEKLPPTHHGPYHLP